MDPLLKKCAELKMPINIHIAEPIWMYEKMDATNDGLMNAYDQFGHHWSFYGIGLNGDVLKKVYRENALKIISR